MIKPIGERVLVQQIKEDSSIVVPDAIDEGKLPQGEVIAVGDIDDVKPGDIVYFSDFAGQEIEYEDTNYLILKLSEILAKC